MRDIICATLLLVSPNMNEAHSQTDAAASRPYGLEPGEYSVGFQLLEEQDHSRVVTGGASPSTTHPRPIRTYIWYPARVSDDAQRMRFGRYAALADEDIWPIEIAGNLRAKLKYSRRAIARSLGPEGFEILLKRPVLAVENAEALKGPFPLIVIGQGLYFESPVAFAALSEYLAGQGFVVATCPLVGTNSPIVNFDVQGLETEVRDLEFVIAQARRFTFVSPDKLGVFGFDQGGFVALILAMRNADVDAFMSVSSGVAGSYIPDYFVASPHFDPLALRVPWLHSQSAEFGPLPAESLFEAAVYSERYLLFTKGMGHADYTSYALIEDRKVMQGYPGYPAATPEALEGHKAVSHYVANFFAAYLTGDAESLAFLSQDPEEAIPGSSMTLEYRPAKPASITYEEFVQAVIAGQVDQAIDEVRALRETEPDHILLKETYLERIVLSLRDTWGYSEEVMPVIRFRAELFPTSLGSQWMLAEGHVAVGDYPAAIEVYNGLLEQNPENIYTSYFKSRLEWLHRQ
jgi:pimeloyl-ACP methyl ester carboxylesterase